MPELNWYADIPALSLGASLASPEGPYDAASLMARMSAEVYGTDGQIEAAVNAVGGAGRQFFREQHTLGVGFVLDDHACVVFRGTVVTSWADWITDLECWPTASPRRHRGFLKAWRAVEDSVTQWLDGQAGNRPVMLAGHSLGAALAILAAFDLGRRFNIAAVMTYGAPRVGLRGFRDAYDRTLGAVTWRFIEGGDAITIVPPPILYRHVGRTAGARSLTPAPPYHLVIKTSVGFDAVSRRLDHANAHFAPGVLPIPASTVFAQTLSALAPLLPLLAPPVSAAFIHSHRWLGAFAAFLISWPAMILLRTAVMSLIDHPSMNYWRSLPARTRRS